MTGLGIWMAIYLAEEDQVVLHTPEPEEKYDPTMSLPPKPISAKDDPFEEESHNGEDDTNPTNRSPYPDSSSSDDPFEHAKPKEENEFTNRGDPEPDSSLEFILSLLAPSHRSYRLCIMGPRKKTTPRNSTPFPSRKRAISPPSSLVSPKRPCPTFPCTPQVRECCMEDII